MKNTPTNYNDEELTEDSMVEYCEAEPYYPEEESEDNNQMPTCDNNQSYYPTDYNERYDSRELQEKRIELANNVVNTFGKALQSREKTKQLEAITKKEIAKIGAKYKTAERGLNDDFRQRGKSLDELYGQLKSDNENVVLEAMRQIGNIHSSTPMQGLKEVAKLYEDDVDKLLEDF